MPGVPRVVRYDDVLLAVCQELRIIPEMVHDHNRHPHKVLARDVVVYTCRHMTRLSYPEIAEKMERTNHSTSIDQYARMERRLAVYEAVDDGRSVGQVVEAVRARVEAVVREPIKIRAIV
jgi:chromosomal replication initiation ATPase DnaA